MSADGHAQEDRPGEAAASALPPSEATAEGAGRRRAALRLRRLCDRQAAAGEPAGLRPPPARILALFE